MFSYHLPPMVPSKLSLDGTDLAQEKKESVGQLQYQFLPLSDCLYIFKTHFGSNFRCHSLHSPLCTNFTFTLLPPRNLCPPLCSGCYCGQLSGLDGLRFYFKATLSASVLHLLSHLPTVTLCLTSRNRDAAAACLPIHLPLLRNSRSRFATASWIRALGAAIF